MLQLPTNLVKLEPAGTPSPYGSFNHTDDPPLIISPDETFPPTVPSGVSPREGQRQSIEGGTNTSGGNLLTTTTAAPVRSSKTSADSRRAAGLLPVKAEVNSAAGNNAFWSQFLFHFRLKGQV